MNLGPTDGKSSKALGMRSCSSHTGLLLSKTSLPLLTWPSSALGSGLAIWYDLGGLGPRGRLSAEKHLGCSKLAGKLPVLKRSCLPEQSNKGWSDCKAGNYEIQALPKGPHLDTCKPGEERMLLPWVHTFLLSNMLLAEAYASGGCFWDNGHLYREDQPSPAPGLRCLNWLAAQSSLVLLAEPSPGNHNYCRNPDQDPRGPWCYISSETGIPEKRPCEDAHCPETTSPAPLASTRELQEKSEAPGDDEAQVFPPANALPARSEAAAVQPVIGISQRVRTNSKEKKDLGTLGYVLGISMMVIIIAIGVGIILGYTYKRGKDLKEQHEQKVCEREMQRITLPLSAFTNPTCEIVDEKTIIVHSNQTPADLQEGSTLLIGQAGTPGA